MLTNCLGACAHLTVTVSEIERDIYEKKSSFYHTPLHSMTPLGGFPLEWRHPLWCGKTRMVSLPDGVKISKIYLFALMWSTNASDGQTNRRTDTWPEIEIFEIQDGGSRHLENRFFAMNHRLIVRFQRNFVWRSRTAGRQGLYDKNCKFLKSNMAEGRHFENR